MLEAEHVPAGVVAIAAPRRQREGADDGVEAGRLKERRLLDLVDQLVLLRRGQRGEAGRAFPFALPPAGSDRLTPSAYEFLLAGVERGERLVDEIDDAGLVGAGPAVDRRHDARRRGRRGPSACSAVSAARAPPSLGGVLRRPGECFFDLDEVRRRPGGTGRRSGAEKRPPRVKIAHDSSPLNERTR